MVLDDKSAGGGFVPGSAEQTGLAPLPPLPQRAGTLAMREVIGLYMRHYSGRDPTRTQRLSWWSACIGHLELQALSDDDVHAALEELAQQRSRYYAGDDVDGRPIFRDKGKGIAAATLNRYCMSLSAVISWAIKKRVAPRALVNPCRSIERRPENNEVVRFLSDDERERLLAACKASSWPRLYALVLLALTCGARKSELTGLRWLDVDLERRRATVGRSKNGDPRVLPLTAAVVEALEPFKGAPAERVFRSTRHAGQAYAFEERWKEAVRAAHIRNFRFHDLRHSCASMLAQSGATLLEIGDVLGHRQLAMVKRYSHLAAEHKMQLVDRLLGKIR